jgi:GABA permease
LRYWLPDAPIWVFVYLLIAISQLRMRARLEREAPERLRLKMWFYPYLTIVGMLAVILAMAFIPEQRSQLILGVVSLAALLLAYVPRLFWGRRMPEAAVPAGSGE